MSSNYMGGGTGGTPIIWLGGLAPSIIIWLRTATFFEIEISDFMYSITDK